MSRELSPSLQAAVKESEVLPFFAVDLVFDGGPLYFWTGPTDQVIDGKTYIASNSLLSISGVAETTEMEAITALVSLSGIPSSVLSLALSEPTRNRPARIYLGALNQYENILYYSEEIGQSGYWNPNNISVVDNAALNPDGDATTADQIVEDTTNDYHDATQWLNSAVRNATYAFRVHLKANGRDKIRLSMNALSGDQARAEFDLVAKTASSSTIGTGSVASVNIVDEGGGWFLCEMIATPSTTGGTKVGFGINLLNSTWAALYTGDGASGCYAWGAQLEVNTAFGKYARTLDKVITKSTVLYTEIFAGSMSEMNISEGAEFSTVTVKIVNKMADLEKPRIRRLTSAYQKSIYPTDTGLDFVESIQDQPVFFGKKGP